MKINIISYVSFVSFRRLFISLQPTLPWGLAASVALSCCQGCQNPGPKLRAPAGPRNGKQMASLLMAACCSRQSRRGNFLFAVIHHQRPGVGERRGGGKTEQRLTPDVWPLSNAFAWHIHGSHSHTHVKTDENTQNWALLTPIYNHTSHTH